MLIKLSLRNTHAKYSFIPLASCYSPGPANMIALFGGVKRDKRWRAFLYCVGVGVAMFILFLLIGYLVVELSHNNIQSVCWHFWGGISSRSCVKIMEGELPADGDVKASASAISFKTGLILAALYPKPLCDWPNRDGAISTLSYWRLFQIAIMVFGSGWFMACGSPSVIFCGARIKKRQIWILPCMHGLESESWALFYFRRLPLCLRVKGNDETESKRGITCFYLCLCIIMYWK